MKGLRFAARLGFALAGLRATWRSEASFRTQGRVALATAVLLGVVRPCGLWVATTIMAIAAVLALEAANAAL